MKKFLEKNKYILYSPLILLIIWAMVFKYHEIYPFGINLFATGDFTDQYLPFLIQLKRVLKGQESFFMFWSAASGSDFFINYCYYLSSPLNLLVVFVPNGAEGIFLSYLTVLRTCLMALTTAILLKNTTNINNKSISILSLIYPLSKFTILYSFNTIWLDCLWLYPLLILALIDLVKNNKYIFYILILFFTILCNFHFSIIICISLLAIFIFINKWNEKKSIKTTAIFVGSSIFAALMCAVILIPSGIILLETLNQETYIQPDLFFGNYLNILQDFFIGSEVVYGTIQYDTIPLFCYLGLLVLVPKYFILKEVDIVNKIKCGLALVFLMFATNFYPFYFILHGLHMPTGIPGRYVFILVLLMIYMGIKVINSDSKIPILYICIEFLLLNLFLWQSNINIELKLLNTILMISYNVLLFFKKPRIFLSLLLIEIILLSSILFYGIEIDLAQDINEKIDCIGNITITPEQQVGINFYDIGNASTYVNIANFNYFTSMQNPIASNLNKLGVSILRNEILVHGLTEPIANLFGIKEIITDEDLDVLDNDSLSKTFKKDNNSNISTFINKKNPSFVHIFNSDILNFKLTDDVFYNINTLYNIFINENNLIYEPINLNLTLQQTKDKDKDYYKQIWNLEIPSNLKNIAILTNSKPTSIDTKKIIEEQEYIFPEQNECNQCNAYYASLDNRYLNTEGNNLSFIETTCTNEIELSIYYKNDDQIYKNTLNSQKMQRNPLEFAIYYPEVESKLTNYFDENAVHNAIKDKNHIKISNIDKNGILTISTFYSPGWKVYVNGEEKEVLKIMDLILGVEVNAGDNVEFAYTTPGFYYGLIISSITCLIFVCLILKEKRRNKKPL